MHFATSIALELGINSDDILGPLEYKFDTTIDAFTELFNTIIIRKAEFDDKDFFCSYYSMLLSLGIMSLGFTWEQIEQAYFEKNKINHERQENGY